MAASRFASTELARIAYGRFGFGSGIAAELGLLAIVGIGSAATRTISCVHWAELRALVVTTGDGAVRPVRAECACVAVAAAVSAGVAAGGLKTSSIRLRYDGDACVLGEFG